MDEIGRGTSTFDGLSLAWAAARHIARNIGARTLFATHYFELTALADELPATVNVHLDAVDHKGALVFLHAVREGPANQSYGLTVAGLAGVPAAVIDEAKRYLAALEREQASSTAHEPQQGLDLFSAATDEVAVALREKLRALDVDTLSPRAALAVLYELAEKSRR
jgi:DNA mismatch repair protein MutS